MEARSLPKDRGDAEDGPTTRRLPPGRPIVLPRVPDSPRYSMEDLTRETGFSARTIRYYVTEGLLTPAHGRGKTATYDKDHLLRLRMIQELKESFLPLETIKSRLADLETSDLESHFAIESRQTEDRWRRISFGRDLELNVRDRGSRDYAFDRAVDTIVQHAKFVLDQLDNDE